MAPASGSSPFFGIIPAPADRRRSGDSHIDAVGADLNAEALLVCGVTGMCRSNDLAPALHLDPATFSTKARQLDIDRRMSTQNGVFRRRQNRVDAQARPTQVAQDSFLPTIGIWQTKLHRQTQPVSELLDLAIFRSRLKHRLSVQGRIAQDQ